MNRSHARRDEGGFTLLEMILALSLLAIFSAKVLGALTTAQRSSDEATRRAVLDDQARRVLQQIAFAVMGANRDTLIPDTGAPLSMSDLRFQVNLGVQDGAVVWSDPEQIALNEAARQVFWSENPGAAEQRRIVWTNIVTPFLEGELPNGMDDNGNGLIDERGLSFDIDRDAVTIRLTLEREGPGGRTMAETVETTVTCRNLSTGD